MLVKAIDYSHIKQQIIDYSKTIGIDKIGFASADNFEKFKVGMQEAKEKGYTTGFEHKNLNERIYPHLIFEQPQTIISIALAYPKLPRQNPEHIKGEKRGVFARASWGEDYHVILNRKLHLLCDYIKSIVPMDNLKFKPMVDTGELIDVRVAERAGIGFVGKNGLLITKEFGSYVYLGEIITNLPFPTDEPVDYGCGDCVKCLQFCPTKALLGNGKMNGKRCLSYQTQTKGFMPEEFRSKIKNTIYGCDICQQVCPYNRKVDSHFHEEMEPNIEETHPLLKPLLTISNKEFKQRFNHMAGSWRGKKPLQRNAIIALGNAKDKSALPLLMSLMESDDRPVIIGTAAWSITQIVPIVSETLIVFFEDTLKKVMENYQKLVSSNNVLLKEELLQCISELENCLVKLKERITND